MWHFSFGDICTSRFWLSFERRPFSISGHWHFSTGPTYHGTIAGFLVCVPGLTIIGHIRGRVS